MSARVHPSAVVYELVRVMLIAYFHLGMEGDLVENIPFLRPFKCLRFAGSI